MTITDKQVEAARESTIPKDWWDFVAHRAADIGEPEYIRDRARCLLLAAAPSSAQPSVDYPNPGAPARLRPAVPEQPPAAQGEAQVPFGWAVLDKKGCTERVISRVHYEFAHIEPLIRSEPDPKELLAYLDREYKGAAPHRLVTLYTTPQPSAPGVVSDAPNFLKLRKLFSLSTAVVSAAFRLADDSADHGDRIEIERHDFDALVAALDALDELQNPNDDSLRYGHQVLAELIRREIGGDYEG